jgi:hypothetical protein
MSYTMNADCLRYNLYLNSNELLYRPAEHNANVSAAAEIVMFSPQSGHTHVINHMIKKVKGEARNWRQGAVLFSFGEII